MIRIPSISLAPLPAVVHGALLATLLAAPAAAQDDSFRLDGLVVTASPTPRPLAALATNVSVLDGAELRAAGLTRVVDALRSVAGLAVVQNGSYGASTSVFLRGGESNYVLVLVDGVQVNQPGGAFDFSGLTLDNVERVEVVRGGASALYGSDAVSGVVHIITSTGGGAPRGTVTGRTGSYGRFDWAAGVTGGSDRAGYSLQFSRATTDGILAFNNRFTNSVLSGSVRVAPDDATRARVSVRLADRRYHFPTDGSGNVVDTNAFTYGDETTVGIQVARRLSPTVEVEAILGHNESDGGTDDAADGPADTLGFFGFTSLDHVRRSSAELRANVRFGNAVATVGGEFEDQAQRSFTESSSEFGTTPGRSEYARWNRAGFAHVSGNRGAVAYNAGVRVEDNQRFGASASWQVGASVGVSSGLRLRGAASRAIKEPTFFENYATGFAAGNPDLDPERSIQWEVGADLSLPDGLGVVRATWFDQSFADLIQYAGTAPQPGGPNFFNVAKAAARGLEVQTEVRRGGVVARAGWTWLDTEVVDPGLDDGPGAEFVTGQALLRRPEHTLFLEAGGAVATGLTVTAGARRVGIRYDRDFSTFPATRVALDAFTDVFVGAEAAVGDRAAVNLRADNLLNRSYQEVIGFAGPGRAVVVGVRIGLGGTP